MSEDDKMYEEMQRRFKARDLELRNEREASLKHYQDFLDTKMKPDLAFAEEQREAIYAELAEFLELKTLIERLEGQKSASSLVNLGHEFFVEAKIPDTSRVIVDVGLGFMAEFTQKEALEFIKLKESSLEKKEKVLSDKIAQIKSNITLLMRGMEDLVNIEERVSEDLEGFTSS